MTTFLIFLTFGSCFLLVFGVNLLIADAMRTRRLKVRTRLESEDRLRNAQRSRLFAIRQALYKSGEGDAAEPVKLGPWQRFVRLVDESGIPMRPSQVALTCAALALCAGAGVGLAWHGWILALCTAAGASLLPILYIYRVRRKRLERLLTQLPEAFDLMGRSMRAGQTISQAMQSVADDLAAPVSDEFGYCCHQQNLGLSPEATMHGLARRTGLLEIKIFVLAVMVHRQTGGNLAELLDKLSTVIRDRDRIRGTIQALTGEGRAQMAVLMALPPLIFCLLMVVNRPYVSVLFSYPNLLVGTVVAMIFGAFSMSRIINFDF